MAFLWFFSIVASVFISIVQEKQKELQGQLDLFEQNAKALGIANRDIFNTFNQQYLNFDSEDVDLKIELEDAQFNLSMAKLRQKYAEIRHEWANIKEIVQKKTAADLGIESLADNPVLRQLDALQKEASKKLEWGDIFEAENREYEVPNCTRVKIV